MNRWSRSDRVIAGLAALVLWAPCALSGCSPRQPSPPATNTPPAAPPQQPNHDHPPAMPPSQPRSNDGAQHSSGNGDKANGANAQEDLAGEIRAGDQKYSGPAVTIELRQLQTYPPQNVATVSLTAPTGGWTLTLDNTEIVGSTLRMYLTLERPGEGEMVTQSLHPLSQTFKDGDTFTRAVAYIHQAQRGVSTFTTNYSLAGRSD